MLRSVRFLLCAAIIWNLHVLAESKYYICSWNICNKIQDIELVKNTLKDELEELKVDYYKLIESLKDTNNSCDLKCGTEIQQVKFEMKILSIIMVTIFLGLLFIMRCNNSKAARSPSVGLGISQTTGRQQELIDARKQQIQEVHLHTL